MAKAKHEKERIALVARRRTGGAPTEERIATTVLWQNEEGALAVLWRGETWSLRLRASGTGTLTQDFGPERWDVVVDGAGRRGYHASGPRSGSCGHSHRTVAAAAQCCVRHQEATGGRWSDRRVVHRDGTPLSRLELAAVEAAVAAQDAAA